MQILGGISMTYHKTEKVVAALKGRREQIIAAAVDVITKSGLEECKLVTIVKRGGFSMGLLYNYFPDIYELHAAAIAHLLARDLAAIRSVSASEVNPLPLQALTAAMATLY